MRGAKIPQKLEVKFEFPPLKIMVMVVNNVNDITMVIVKWTI